MGYYLAMEGNVLSSHKNSWRNLSEKSQSTKTMYCNIPNLWHSGKGKIMDIVKRLVNARVWGKGGRGELLEHLGIL